MPNTLPPSLTGKSLLDDKKERIAAKVEEKKEILDPIQARLDRQLAMANARVAQGWESVKQAQVDNAALIQAREDAFDADRSTPVEKYLRDAGIKASQMLVGAVGGGISLVSDLVSKGAGEALNTVLPGAEGLSDVLDMGNPMRAYGAAPATQIETPEVTVPSVAPKVSAATRAAIDGMESWTSKQGQASARVAAGERAEDTARIDAEYVADLKNGNGKLSAQLAREAKNAGSAFIHAVDDPNNLVNNLATAAPTVAIAAMTGGGTLGVMGVTGAMEGAGAYQQVTDQIAATSYEDLKSQFPDVTRMIEEGASEEAIRAHLVTEVGLPAAATTGIAAALISKISLPFAKDPLGMARKAAAKEVATGIGRPLSGSIPGLVKGELLETGQEAKRLLLRDMLSEATEEAGQGLAAQMAVNQANRDAGNTSVELLDNTGEVIGQGAAVGALMPAALRAPGYALRGTALAGGAVAPALKAAGSVVSSGTGAAVRAAGKLTEDRANKNVRQAAAAEAGAQADAATAQANTEVRQAVVNDGLKLDLPKDTVTSAPAKVQEQLGTATEGELDDLEILARINKTWDREDMGPEERAYMATYAQHAEAGLNKAMRQVATELSQEELTDERRVTLNNTQNALLELRNGPALRAVREAPEKLLQVKDLNIMAKELNAVLDELPAETRAAADTLRSMVNTGRTSGLTAEAIEATHKLYSSDLTEDEDTMFRVSAQVARAQEEHEAAVAKRKTIKTVAAEMRTGSFQLGDKNLESIRDQMDAVMELSAAGMYTGARDVLDHMKWWVNHQANRAVDFDQKAMAELEEFRQTGKWARRELMGERLAEDGQSIARGKKQIVLLDKPAGVEFGHAIREDAEALVQTYNSLIELLPETMRPAAITTPLTQSWSTNLPQQTPTPQAEQAPASKETAREAAPKPVVPAAAPQAPEAKAEDKAPGTGEQAGDGEQASSEAVDKPKARFWHGVRVIDAFDEMTAGSWKLFNDGYEDSFAFNYLTDSQEKIGGTFMLEGQKLTHFNITSNKGEGSTSPAILRHVLRELIKAFPQITGIEGFRISGVRQGRENTAISYHIKDGRLLPVATSSEAGNQTKPKSRVTADQAKRLTDEGLQYRLDNLLGKQVDGTATEEDRATLQVLDNEMSDRETRAAEAIAAQEKADRTEVKTETEVKVETEEETEEESEEEQDAAPTAPSTMAERFKGLITDFKGLRNKFLTGFKLVDNSKSIFVQRDDAIADVRAALAAGPDAVRKLFADRYDYTGSIDESAMSALSYLFGKQVDDMRTELNRLLNETLGPKQREALNSEKGANYWTSIDYLSLHLVTKTKGANGNAVFAYHPKVMDAMIMSGVRWALNNLGSPNRFDEEQVAKLFPKKIIPHALRPYLRHWHRQDMVQGAIASDLSQMLGIVGLDEESRSTTDGLPKALAGDIMNVMLRMGDPRGAQGDTKIPMMERFQIKTADAYEGASQHSRELIAELSKKLQEQYGPLMTFVRFPDIASDDRPTGMKAMADRLGKRLPVLDAILGTGRTVRAHVGRPPAKTQTKVRKTGGRLGRGQRKLVERLNNNGHALNVPMADALYKGLSEEVRLRFLGKPAYNPENTNRGYLEVLEGKTLSALRTDYEVRMLMERMQDHAKETGKSIEEVLAYWEYEIQTNGRAHQLGFGGQADKLARDLFVPVTEPMDFGNAEHEMDYWLALAQALGLKTTNTALTTVVAQIQEKITAESGFGPLMQAFRNFDPANPPEDGGLALIEQFEAMKFGHPQRAFNALLTHVRYERADRNQPFKHSMVYEIDGKTDGPINALVQFGLGFMDKRLLKQLAQGGLFIGRLDATSLNQANDNAEVAGEKFGDLYLNGAEHWGANFRKHLQSLDPKVRSLVRVNMHGLRSIGRVVLQDVKDEDGAVIGQEYEAARDLFKNPLTQKVYGAADATMAIRAMKELVSHYHQMVNQALSQGRLLTDREKQEITYGAGVAVVADKEGNLGVKFIGVPSLETREDLLKFQLGPVHQENILSIMAAGAGKVLADQINEEMGSVEPTMQALYVMTGFQAWASHNLYEKLYRERREALVAEGKLTRAEALSRKDEEEIKAQVVHLSPRFHTSQTEGGDGIIINERSRGNKLPTIGNSTNNNRVHVSTRSLLGGFTAAIERAGFDPNAGVRIAAQLNIAAGDAAMMGGIFTSAIRNWFNVFDGLEVAIGQLRSASEAANAAVKANWDFDLLGSILEQFAKFDLDTSKMTKEEVMSLAEVLRLNRDKNFMNNSLEKQQEHLALMLWKTRKTLEMLHSHTKAIKRILGELHIAVDHMSGRERPFTQRGEVLQDQEAVLDYINQRLTEIKEPGQPTSVGGLRDALADIEMMPFIPEAEDESATPAAKPTLKLTATPQEEAAGAASGVTTFDGKAIRASLKKHTFSNKVAGFVASRIMRLIPDDLVIHRGETSALLARAQADHPKGEIESIKNGLYINKTIYLPIVRTADGKMDVAASETDTVHELLHAVTYALLSDYYHAGGKRLSAGQRQAVKNLEALANHMIGMTPADDGSLAYKQFTAVQQILKGLRDGGKNFDMVSELLAYTLTNKHVQTALKHQTGLPALRKITNQVLGWVKNFLGLPSNPSVDGFLVQTIYQLHRLTFRQIDNNGPLQPQRGQHNSLDSAEGVDVDPAHDQHLTQVGRLMEELIQSLPEDLEYFAPGGFAGGDSYSRGLARGGGVEAANRMEAAYFHMTAREKEIYAEVHAAMTAVRELDPQALIEIQRVHTQALREIIESDLLEPGESMDDPTVRDVVVKERLQALRSMGQQDLYGRSELLPNFVALASVYPPLRARLMNMQVQGTKVLRTSADDVLRTGTNKAIELLGERAMRTNGAAAGKIIDLMMQRMVQAQQQSRTTGKPGLKLMDQAEQRTKAILHMGSPVLARAEARVRTFAEETSSSVLAGAANITAFGLHLGKSLLNKDLDGDILAVSLNQVLNEAKIPEFFRNVGQEMLGTHADNAEIHRLLNLAKTKVSQIRQRLREQVPSLLQKLFKEALSKRQWQTLHKTIGLTDLQSLLSGYSVAEMAALMRDPGALDSAIEKTVGKLPQGLASVLKERAEALGRYMVSKDNQDGDALLARNAHAMLVTTQRMFGTEVANRTQALQNLDQLISLYAVKHTAQSQLEQTAAIFEKDPEGSKQLLTVMQSMVQLELDRLKPLPKSQQDQLRMNMSKGYIPTTTDPRKDLVLASSKQGEELLRRGYKLVAPYRGDAAEGGYDLAYYSTKWGGGLATYNQGAMQTVEHSLMGIDSLTGLTLDPAAQTTIKDRDEVFRITDQKWRAAKRAGSFRAAGTQLLPVFNGIGEVVAYMRPMDARLLSEHTRREGHLAQSVGMWLGRQAEESLADSLNSSVIQALHKRWEDEKSTRAGEYVQINDPKGSKVVKDTWDALPRTTQKEMLKAFGPKVMVRADLKDNALGYRAASVADIFTGTSNLNPEVRKALENVAFALAGKRAYPLLVTGERAWQGLIGTAKDVIVVRSGVVAVANLLANQVQLLQMTGWNPARLLKVQMMASRELGQYLQNQSRLSEIVVQLAAGTTVDKTNELHLEKKLLEDNNKRLSIEPLLRAGMLPTIAEGLTEQDQYTLLGDGMRWIEERAEKLPKGVLTAAKYAVVSKDTALYQGLNRMVQFGDFMAKVALYQAMTENAGKPARESSEEWQILDKVNQAFVNYNLLPGRGRDYLEGMGVTWFWNYKLRIQKIVIQQFRENPLRFMAMGMGANWVDLDSLMTSSAPMINWEYSVGLDQLWRAHQMLLWRTLMM